MGNRHGGDGPPTFNDEMIAEFCRTSGMTENQVKKLDDEMFQKANYTFPACDIVSNILSSFDCCV